MSDYIIKGSYIYQGLDELVTNAQKYAHRASAVQQIIYADEKIIQNNFVNSLTVVHLPSLTVINKNSPVSQTIAQERRTTVNNQQQSNMYNYSQNGAEVLDGIVADVKVESDLPEYLKEELKLAISRNYFVYLN